MPRIEVVKIAPMAHWCRETFINAGDNPNIALVVGLPVEIYPATMVTDPPVRSKAPCRERNWLLTTPSSQTIHQLLGYPFHGQDHYVCEHVLEMD